MTTSLISVSLALTLIFISSFVSFLLGMFYCYTPKNDVFITREKNIRKERLAERDSMIDYMSKWKLVQDSQSKNYTSAIQIGDGVYELIE